ncbi:hypothetical protein B0H11DRAFT_1910230 [Mycena galericulata]|nr:hypothetical protein B0H11DRAFT_1910230 [Mycena galericulata]
MSTSAHYPSPFPEVMLGKSTQAIQLRTVTGFQPQTHKRCGMDPTILLLSPVQLASPSTWEVFREKKPYWTAATMLRPNGIHEGNYRYITSIAIDLWEVISADMNFRNGERIEWTIVHFVYRLEDDPNHPFAELMYTFEPFTSKPTLLERSPDNSKDPFRYMHMIHSTSRPTARSIFFPGKHRTYTQPTNQEANEEIPEVLVG